jgi:hypothetical protein
MQIYERRFINVTDEKALIQGGFPLDSELSYRDRICVDL